MRSLLRKTSITLLLALTVVGLKAQQEFSLEQAIAYALKNNENLKNARVAIDDADAQVYETRSDGLPQVNATFGYTNNVEIPVSVLPASTFDPSAPEGETVAVKFGVQHQSNLGVNASQMIFDGSFFIGLKAAKKLREKVVVDEAKEQEDVREQVMKAYYLVLVNQIRTELVETNIATLDSTLKDTKALYENGFAEKIDVSRLQVQMNNLYAERSAVRQAIFSAKNLLKLTIGMPVENPIEISGELEGFDFTYSQAEVEAFSVIDRLEVQQIEYLKQLAELDVKNVTSQYIPTVNFTAGWGRNSANDVFNNLWNNDREWFSSANIGVNVNIPIFDGLRKKYSIQRKRYQLETLNNQSSLLVNNLRQQLDNSKVALDVNVERLEVQQENMELAREVMEITREKYTEGVGSNLELVVADQDFKQAEVNYLVALYDAIVAKIELDKALGKLN
ncbi:outer membrane protein TolC [Roseivirga pacifica]|uniref:Outer membrane protein TolC n=1 Tax=Roseivirga pacifica TaxID=1267423 RepID=A0A1I0RR08_9BACT|nr:TolC family protein [Roseivirga pacifica]MCO6357964.1 TolC family protein [Roseivirga pacifica]MCO6366403.1 TolC family protein [Roseivirga pacifica]MCO6370888.1 TolC family protein [Roseivirga pacifica]MCO6373696.1 TolC family protein [Roseivirga pacifica]MCO6380677.1 TolC family protein [Roseivirga pacifica]